MDGMPMATSGGRRALVSCIPSSLRPEGGFLLSLNNHIWTRRSVPGRRPCMQPRPSCCLAAIATHNLEVAPSDYLRVPVPPQPDSARCPRLSTARGFCLLTPNPGRAACRAHFRFLELPGAARPTQRSFGAPCQAALLPHHGQAPPTPTSRADRHGLRPGRSSLRAAKQPGSVSRWKMKRRTSSPCGSAGACCIPPRRYVWHHGHLSCCPVQQSSRRGLRAEPCTRGIRRRSGCHCRLHVASPPLARGRGV